jgi:hypothetical protein
MGQPKLEKDQNMFVCSSSVQDKNMLLKHKCHELEFMIKKMKEGSKNLERLRKQEIRWRENKQGLVIAVCVQ